MQIVANVAEVWVFSRTSDGPRYLVLEASQEKADAFFGGHRFGISGTSMREGKATVDLLRRGLGEYGLEACALWAVEHVSTIFNRRVDAIQLIPAFAAEVVGLPEPELHGTLFFQDYAKLEYGSYEWADANESNSS